jgi:hypothetical protein
MAKTNPKTNQIKLMPTNKYKGGNGVFMKTNFASPVKTTKKKSTWGHYIDIYETKVSPILIAIATRMDKPEGSYITPMVKALNNDENGNLTAKWKIISFLSRRAGSNGLKPNPDKRNTMPKSADSSYEWEAIVAFRDEEKKENPQDIGQHIADHFSDFSKTDGQVSVPIADSSSAHYHFTCTID